MFAPKLYEVRKYPVKDIILLDRIIVIDKDEEKKYHVKEQDNLLFRQIRLISSDNNYFNKYIVFVDCKSYGKNKEDNLSDLIRYGFRINGQEFVYCERSASMTRNSILSFVDASISEELDKRVKMGAHISKTVLSKYYAYRGLLLSSCHCIEDWYPKVIIAPDYYRVIPKQRIRHICDTEIQFTDKNGNDRVWTQKDIAEDTRDVEINVFDGCGIHHPLITLSAQEALGCSSKPTSILWRAPYIKGVTHEVNYIDFFRDRGVVEIEDIWKVKHGVTEVDEPMIIMFESMYKGLKYFKKTNSQEDWKYYWEKFREYQHCFGITKWNFSLEEEPVYTRANYQILQDLKLDYSEFAKLAKDSVKWIEKIIQGDPIYTYCFLGLFADKHKALNCFTRAVLKNPQMLDEGGVRNFIINLINKKIDDMKCGKLYVKGSFKFIVQDLIMAMEHIAGLQPTGCLQSNEFFSKDAAGPILGERLIERNPHICHSEHTILTGTDNELRTKYLPELTNVCMVNGDSLVMQRLQGCDSDGDLVLVVDSDLMMSGVNRESIIVMDTDDKITVEEEEDTIDNKVKITLRTMKNLIGEYSNFSSAYHNKTPKTKEQKAIYEKYIEIIATLTGKSIDYAKTGVLYPMPRNIAKFGRPLPYFMRYRNDYYKRLKLSRSGSIMNRLCWEIEKWEKQFRWKRTDKSFDYSIMIDDSIPVDDDTYLQIEEIYLEFCEEMKKLKRDEREIRLERKDFSIKWDYYYEKYREKCECVCRNKKLLANIAVDLCYRKHPNKNKKFIWRVAGDGVVENLEQVEVSLPLRTDDGEYEYLGKRYTLLTTAKYNETEKIEIDEEGFLID